MTRLLSASDWAGALRAAEPRDYAMFLTNYLSAGGKITHCYHYEFARAGFFLATKDCRIPTGCGVYALYVIVPEGVTVTRYLDKSRGSWDHGVSYHMSGSVSSERCTWVPLYPDVACLMEDVGWRFVEEEFADGALPVRYRLRRALGALGGWVCDGR